MCGWGRMWRKCVSGSRLILTISPSLMNEVTRLSQMIYIHYRRAACEWRGNGVIKSRCRWGRISALPCPAPTPPTPGLIIFACHLLLSPLHGRKVTEVVTVGISGSVVSPKACNTCRNQHLRLPGYIGIQSLRLCNSWFVCGSMCGAAHEIQCYWSLKRRIDWKNLVILITIYKVCNVKTFRMILPGVRINKRYTRAYAIHSWYILYTKIQNTWELTLK